MKRTLVRSAKQADSDEIARLCGELGYSASAPEIAARLQAYRNADRLFVAVADGAQSSLLGWVAAEHRLLLESGERVEIIGLIVDPKARRMGIGRSLVAAAEAWAATRGISTLFVRSSITRDSSHRFYAGIGYARTKTQHAYTKTLPPLA